jgi:DNA-binding PadR family transcriptional regulator
MNSTSTLEYALIGLIRPRPQSGYDLRKTFITTGMRHYSDSPGSIYPALRRVEKRGWIQAVPRGEDGDPRKRQLFALTPNGQDALITWLSQPVGRDDVVFRLAELMLRFSFMDGSVPRVTAIQFLTDFERELSIYAAESRTKLEAMRAVVGVHTGVLAYEFGIEVMERHVSWARKARKALTENPQ